MKAQRGGRDNIFFLASALNGGGWSTPRPCRFPRERDAVPIVQEAGWVPGLVWTAAESLSPTGIRFPDLPTCRESLYRLRYLGIPCQLNPVFFKTYLAITFPPCSRSPFSQSLPLTSLFKKISCSALLREHPLTVLTSSDCNSI